MNTLSLCAVTERARTSYRQTASGNRAGSRKPCHDKRNLSIKVSRPCRMNIPHVQMWAFYPFAIDPAYPPFQPKKRTLCDTGPQFQHMKDRPTSSPGPCVRSASQYL